MKNDREILEGVAIIIDDEIGNSKSIDKLISDIEKRCIPCVKYKEIPDEKVIKHFHGISFVIIDWNFIAGETYSQLQGVKVGGQLQKQQIVSNIEFIKKVKKHSFSPVFIFTNEDIDEVKSHLKSKHILFDNKPNFLFVKDKSYFNKHDLFDTINEWVNTSPSIYVLNEWEKEYSKSKNSLFGEFYEMNPSWPKILWDTSDSDGVNPSHHLGNIISRNLITRMSPFDFDPKILNNTKKNPNPEEMRKVLQGEKFVLKNKLHDTSIATGDVFKINRKYYINIRPDCDNIPNRSGDEDSIDDVCLYLLKGTQLSVNKESELFNKERGNFPERSDETVIFCMYNSRTIVFKFKTLKQDKWVNIKEKRIGRLLPPYITRIQQRYSHYLQREGLSKVPAHAIQEPTNKSD